ncbi:MAG: hypothetical protein ACI837_001132 [Crocinitomicaceae bacterium]|jgi:hypothetical protein
MKKLITAIALIFMSSQMSFGQPPIVITEQIFNSSCEASYNFCGPILHRFNWNHNGCLVDPLYYQFSFDSPFTNSIVLTMLTINGSSYEWFGPFTDPADACTQIQAGASASQSGSLTPGVPVGMNNMVGTYILKVTTPISICSAALRIELGGGDPYVICDPELCIECITSFSPTPGKYVVSAWVKERGASPTTLSYSNVSIDISFPGGGSLPPLLPKGKIIDGWQRIESEIEVPATATGIDIQLTVSSGDAYFDDIRFFPFDGSMMSYVYDPQSLRLMAELDERNYATLYEYDEEGKLVRVKKETEKGVMTIQENRDNIKK